MARVRPKGSVAPRRRGRHARSWGQGAEWRTDGGEVAEANLLRKTRVVRTPVDDEAIYLSATLDHELLSKPIHAWLFRRWSMFYVATNSAVAVLLALPVGRLIDITSWSWFYWSVGSALMLGVVAGFAWRDTMGIWNRRNFFGFQVLRGKREQRFRYGVPKGNHD